MMFLSCTKPGTGEVPGDDIPTPPENKAELVISSFSIAEYPDAQVDIDDEAAKIGVTVPYKSDVSDVTIIFTTDENVTASPESGSKADLTKPLSIFLSSEEGKARKYTVNTTILKNSDARLLSLSCEKYSLKAKISGTDATFTFPYGADLTNISLTAVFTEGAVSEPDLSNPVDLSQPLSLAVTAADGVSTNTYSIIASHSPQDVAVRGVYVPSPSHTASFISYDNIVKSVNLLDELNFNCIFICGWAQTKVAWNSAVLKENTTYTSETQGNMYANYTGGSGDALADLISVAHSKDIKVILWMEYGFMHAAGGVNVNNPLLAAHPDWMGVNSKGGYANYNGSDYYLNAYNPEVREFMLSLMEEALELYPDLDGIQGDDRMPAMPRDAGYDELTKSLYKEATGKDVPSDNEDPDWIRWRLDVLNGFADDMASRFRAKKSDCIVCFAPNKYPWSETNLMQDWPSWIRSGAADFVTVQFYVLSSYMDDVSKAMGYVLQNSEDKILNPAMILKNGGNILSEENLVNQLRYNRAVGTCGESQFWFDGLYASHVQEVFRTFYPGKAIFPTF